MRVDELIVEVRDASLSRIGQILPQDLVGATFVVRYNNVGSWSIKLPHGHPLGELLRLPGYGILITGPNGDQILSGPTLSAKLTQSPDNIDGNWEIIGASDDIYLAERLAYPTPATADVTAQTQGHDRRTGVAETVIKGYVDDNIGPSAPVARRVTGLVIEADGARGETISAAARFNNIQELIYDLAQVGQIGYRITQVGDDLEFSVFEPVDRSATIRMDIQNRKLNSAVYSYGTAKVTRAIVAGQGEADNRIFLERTNADSLAAESTWGRRIELFKDARQAKETTELETAGDEALADIGKTIVEMSVTPTDDETMVYGVDWGLGDRVTVVANDIEATAVVTEVGIQIGSDGVRVGATVGTPVGIEFEAKLLAKQQNHEQRISNLEKTTGYGINTVYQPNGGTIGGTQPTASGPFISGSFNRFGNMVHFNIQVDMDNITNFGTGHYFVTLPHPARVRYTFANGHLLDFSSGKTYNLVGECAASSDQVLIYYIGPNGQMDAFEHNAPINLTTADYFDISGTYEIEE